MDNNTVVQTNIQTNIQSNAMDILDNTIKMFNNNKRKTKNVVIKKKSEKIIKTHDFQIPTYHNCNDLKTKRFTVSQLKYICKYYKLRVTGNKPVLIERCYTFLNNSYYAIKIQKLYKGHLARRYIKMKGPGLLNPKICVNDTDFFTMDEFDKLPHWQFYSFEEKGYIYGFDICSLYNLITNDISLSKNPYTREPFTKEFLIDFRKSLHLSNLLGYKPHLEIDNPVEELNEQQKLQMRINAVFQEIDNLGNYSNPDWFSKLNRSQIVRYVRELFDIWNYRLSICNVTKCNIFPPLGNPFMGTNIQTIHVRPIESILPDVVSIMENLVMKGVDRNSKGLGALYCLGALTIVSKDASDALPWLYETFFVQ